MRVFVPNSLVRTVSIFLVAGMAACGGGADAPGTGAGDDVIDVPDGAGGDVQGGDSGPDAQTDADRTDIDDTDATSPEDGGDADASSPEDGGDADASPEDVADMDTLPEDVELDGLDADATDDTDVSDVDDDASDVETDVPDVVESFCGDGNVDDGEACDPGSADASDLCRSDCSLADGAFCQTCAEEGACASSLDVCFELDSTNVCLPTCAEGEACPNDSTCTEVDGGASICIPDALTCDGCIDGDGDGYGVGIECSGPDCNDGLASISPVGTEVCDGADNDCDGGIDEELLIATWADGDEDGFGDPATRTENCSIGAGRVTQGDDCDDGNPEIRPDAQELCNEIDDDCDGDEDEDDSDVDVTCWYADVDGDGFGGGTCISLCAPPAASGWTGIGGDCNDTLFAVNPNATEVCNNIDDDCDGETDISGDAAPSDATLYLLDADGDGYGDPLSTRLSCPSLADEAWVLADRVDCDDTNAAVLPGGTEVAADGVDSDCDGLELCWADRDEDGFGDSEEMLRSASLACEGEADCTLPGGVSGTCTVVPPGEVDCDPTRFDVYPGAEEFVDDGIDSDCDAQEVCYLDVDEDGYVDQGRGEGVAATSVTSVLDCDAIGLVPSPTFPDQLDCNPELASVNPGATEVAGNHDDDNCDGVRLCWDDADADGWGTSTTYATSGLLCDTLINGDCDDTRADVNPAALETTGGEDLDCSGTVVCFVDADGDRYARSGATLPSADRDCADSGELSASARLGDDCNDDNAAINPAASEAAGNSVDENCDGSLGCLADNDGDGYLGTPVVLAPGVACSTLPSGDCNDNNRAVSPGATETVGDNVDSNCDDREVCHFDADNDGFTSGVGTTAAGQRCGTSGQFRTVASAAVDCAPNDPRVSPGAVERVGDTQDENCNGLAACYRDGDADGYVALVSTDTVPVANCSTSTQREAPLCDATNTRRPGLQDLPDLQAFDSNCDGRDGVVTRDQYVSSGDASAIQTALNACNGITDCNVLVATGTYNQTTTLTVRANTGLHGGYVAGTPADSDGDGDNDTFTARHFGNSTPGVPAPAATFNTSDARYSTILRLTSAPASGVQVSSYVIGNSTTAISGLYIDGNGQQMGAGISYVGLSFGSLSNRASATLVYIRAGNGGPGASGGTSVALDGRNTVADTSQVISGELYRLRTNTCDGQVQTGGFPGVGASSRPVPTCTSFECNTSDATSGTQGADVVGLPGWGGSRVLSVCDRICDNATRPPAARAGQAGWNADLGRETFGVSNTTAIANSLLIGLSGSVVTTTPTRQANGSFGSGGGGGGGGGAYVVYDDGLGDPERGLRCPYPCGSANLYDDDGGNGGGGGPGGCPGQGGLDGQSGGHSIGVYGASVTLDRVWVFRGRGGAGGNGQNGGNGAEGVPGRTGEDATGDGGDGGNGGTGGGGSGGTGGRGGSAGDSIAFELVGGTSAVALTTLGTATPAVGGQGGLAGRSGGVTTGSGPRSADGTNGVVR